MTPASAIASEPTPQNDQNSSNATVSLVKLFNQSSTPEVTAPSTVKLTFERIEIRSIAKPEPKPEPKPEESKAPEPAPVVKEASTNTTPAPVAQKAVTTTQAATPSPAASSTPAAPPVSVSPGSAQAEAANQMQAFGWGADQLACLIPLWQKESGWNVLAANPSSGAYGIPQSLPGSKMASAGADWQTNPATQIKWGLGYIKDRYQTPCGAWNHSITVGWY